MSNENISVTVVEGAKCNRCWKYSTMVGINWSWPDLCDRCVPVLEAIRCSDPDHPVWGIEGTAEQNFKNHPIRTLALDPSIPKLIRDGRIIEVWGSEEQMPWRFNTLN